ncbi:MAG: DUF1491 family protein [Pseudomonadota bacterium]
MAARLTSEFWVSAYLARLSREAIFAHVAHKGDPTAGAVAIKIATMNRRASLFMRSYDSDGERVWAAAAEDADETEVDDIIARQRGFDRDLWVIEVEDPRGRHLLDEDGLT